MHWWIGENLLQSNDPEFDADEMLSYYCESGFIKPAMEESKVVGFKMDPVIRYAVIYLAERKGFMDFDFSWRPTGNFTYSKRACLVDTEEGSNSGQLMRFDNPQKLQTLFYVSGRSHDLTPQWFSSIRNVKIVCLGKWELAGNWRCLEDIKFLQGLKYLKNLRFLSLEGFSEMSGLPVSASRLKNLIVLNLKDCESLATLPNDIGLLKHLTHLDISGCPGLKFIPKGTEQLMALQVLKGFVIGDRYEGRLLCNLDDLVGLKKLKKLSVIIRNRTPEKLLVVITRVMRHRLLALKRFPSLKILRISWEEKVSRNMGLDSSMQWLPPGLEKLDLRRIPIDKIDLRAMPQKLKKLYIIDANLSHLYLDPGDLRILRLQNLPKLDLTDIHIEQLRQLIYIEVVGCIMIDPLVGTILEAKEFRELDESLRAA